MRADYRIVLLFCVLLAPFSQAGETPSLDTGTLKIGSSPIDCTVRFRQESVQKTTAILTFEKIPEGRYDVEFEKDGAVVTKSVSVIPDRVTFVFGNLSGATRTTLAPSASDTPHPPFTPRVIGKPVPDADLFFETAEILRKAINPFMKPRRYKRAERIYLQILRRWPESNKVESCHFQLGNLYESVFYRDYHAAIRQYEDVLEHNFQTPFEARWRIAVLHERLKETDAAIEWYDLAARHSPDDGIRKQAEERAAALRAKMEKERQDALREQREQEERAQEAAAEAESEVPLRSEPETQPVFSDYR